MESIKIGFVIIFNILFDYNTWIAFAHNNAVDVPKIFYYFLSFQKLELHYLILSYGFICWLPWKDQVMEQIYEGCTKCQNKVEDLHRKWKNYWKRAKKRPKYKVIYGGEDSVTKKLLDDCSV
uniref:Uncharacterized protein n=1 Tax=Caenorhabditis tropicalis TaxID=1561998 RepID=A0A1I7UGK4_9PELO